MNINFDVDIDLFDRDKLLSVIPYISARADNIRNFKHQSGVYLQPIPYDPFTGISTINYDTAEKMGYFKVDLLNNSVYEKIETNEELDALCAIEPMWELLEYEEILKRMPQISDHGVLVRQYRPKSVKQLAMVISLIRPAKQHLVGRTFEQIEKEIWEKPDDGGYHFKKSHSIAYAMSIVVALNKLTAESN